MRYGISLLLLPIAAHMAQRLFAKAAIAAHNQPIPVWEWDVGKVEVEGLIGMYLFHFTYITQFRTVECVDMVVFYFKV